MDGHIICSLFTSYLLPIHMVGFFLKSHEIIPLCLCDVFLFEMEHLGRKLDSEGFISSINLWAIVYREKACIAYCSSQP